MLIDGVIVVNKPWGKTSHDMVYFIRRAMGIKKVGHTGTLDPAATGVLPICIGSATKAAELLTSQDKSYRAELVLGMTTDTLDAEGEILTEQPHDYVNEELLLDTIKKFTGEIDQIPPMFSAIKKDGRKLYELARAGVTIEREKRLVKIDRIELLEFDTKTGIAKLDVDCSKGTYIRTLCEDIGAALGCGAYMNRLERTKSGRFSIQNSFTPEEITQKIADGELEQMLIPVDELFEAYPKLILDAKRAELVINGVRIRADGLVNEEEKADCYRLYDENQKFLAISEYTDGLLILKKAFWM